jgi:hypothetical protein
MCKHAIPGTHFRAKLRSNRQRRKEGTFCASELAGIEPTPPAHEEQGMPAFVNYFRKPYTQEKLTQPSLANSSTRQPAPPSQLRHGATLPAVGMAATPHRPWHSLATHVGGLSSAERTKCPSSQPYCPLAAPPRDDSDTTESIPKCWNASQAPAAPHAQHIGCFFI